MDSQQPSNQNSAARFERGGNICAWLEFWSLTLTLAEAGVVLVKSRGGLHALVSTANTITKISKLYFFSSWWERAHAKKCRLDFVLDYFAASTNLGDSWTYANLWIWTYANFWNEFKPLQTAKKVFSSRLAKIPPSLGGGILTCRNVMTTNS